VKRAAATRRSGRIAVFAAAILLSLSCSTNVNPSKELAELVAAVRRPGKVVVVNHWATWCGPCVDELPYLAAVAKQFEGRVEFIGVSWDRFTEDGPIEEVRAHVDQVRAETKTTYPTVLAPPDAKGVVHVLELEAEFIPQTYVIGADGARVWSRMGEILEDSDQAAFVAAIQAALAKAKQ
jgi:thiol-disulfide isomerase/thioredoxin